MKGPLTAKELKPGVFYEDCRFHPMVCVGVNFKRDYLLGISLVDGYLSGCSISSCGVRILSPTEALRNRIYGLPNKIREEILSFNWGHPNDRKALKKNYEREKSQGIYFPDGNPKDIKFTEQTVGTKLRRK